MGRYNRPMRALAACLAAALVAGGAARADDPGEIPLALEVGQGSRVLNFHV